MPSLPTAPRFTVTGRVPTVHTVSLPILLLLIKTITIIGNYFREQMAVINKQSSSETFSDMQCRNNWEKVTQSYVHVQHVQWCVFYGMTHTLSY